MTEPTNPTSEPTSEPTPDDAPVTTGEPAEVGGDDGGAALERAQEAIDEAQDAQGTVAAHDDITTRDGAMAGEYSEDPGDEGGHP